MFTNLASNTFSQKEIKNFKSALFRFPTNLIKPAFQTIGGQLTAIAMNTDRERSWVIDLEKKLACNNKAELSEEEIQWKKPSIFKLPDFVRMIKKDIFTPKVVAIGPYHHHNRQLQPLESHKERALHHFLKRGIKPLGIYVRKMKSAAEELQGSYVDLDEEWKNEDNFIKLMLTDGCFMLEVMRLDSEHCKNYYAPSDPFFGSHALQHKVPYMRRDMLILENQLPLLVFKKLVSVEKDVDEEEAECMIMELLVRFFVPRIYNEKDSLAEFTKTIHGFHALDVYRRSRLFISTKAAGQSPRSPPAPITNFAVMRPATRLHEAGITFEKSKYSSALTTIDFNSRRGILTLPRITVDDSTESEFLNMVALEHLHTECGSEISSYVTFMDALVDSAEDVELLHRHRLVNNGVGSDEDFAKLFNSMSKEVIVDQGGSFGLVQEAVEKYCQKRLNIWRANLLHTYFRNPWSSISVVVAAFVILLAVLSTVISIMPLLWLELHSRGWLVIGGVLHPGSLKIMVQNSIHL